MVPPPRPAARGHRADRARRERLELEADTHRRRAYRERGRRRGLLWTLCRIRKNDLSFLQDGASPRSQAAPAAIDEAELAAFRAGLRRRYTDEEILEELRAAAERLGRSPTMREFARPRGARPSADRHRALRDVERREARGRALPAAVPDARRAARAAARPGRGARADADRARPRRARALAALGVALRAHVRLVANALREAGFEVLQGEERLERAIEQGAALARKLGRLPRMADWGRRGDGTTRCSRSGRCTGCSTSARRVDRIPVPRARAAPRGGRRGRCRTARSGRGWLRRGIVASRWRQETASCGARTGGRASVLAVAAVAAGSGARARSCPPTTRAGVPRAPRAARVARGARLPRSRAPGASRRSRGRRRPADPERAADAAREVERLRIALVEPGRGHRAAHLGQGARVVPAKLHEREDGLGVDGHVRLVARDPVPLEERVVVLDQAVVDPDHAAMPDGVVVGGDLGMALRVVAHVDERLPRAGGTAISSRSALAPPGAW